jgi:hypothetical protein
VLQPGFDAPYRCVCDNGFVDVFKRGRNLAFSSTVGFGSDFEDTGHCSKTASPTTFLSNHMVGEPAGMENVRPISYRDIFFGMPRNKRLLFQT